MISARQIIKPRVGFCHGKVAVSFPAQNLGVRSMKRYISGDFRQAIQVLADNAAAGKFLRTGPSIATTKSVRKHPTVLLLHPPGACSAFTRSGSQYPPLGLNQLKALIGDSSRVDVVEADGNGWTDERTMQVIREQRPLAVGMTVTCGTKGLVHAWSSVVRNLDPSYRPLVLVGGPAAAFESDTIFADCPNVDVVVKGEGEVTFPKIVSLLEKSAELTDHYVDSVKASLVHMAGVCVRDMVHPSDASIPTVPADAFATMPFPDLSASPVSNFTAPDALRRPMITMMTQRGCIAQCAFCNTPQIHGRRIRGWTNEQIVAELKRLVDAHGIQEVSFVDDVFTNRPGGGPLKLCRLMMQEQLDLTWYCNVRADQITAKMAHAMKAAGCHQVFMGFESGCDDMLKRIQKGETVADLERGAKLCRQAGLKISIGFIVGLPGETQESVGKTIALCNRVQPDRVQFTRFTPIPGSALAANAHAVDDGGDLTAGSTSGFHNRSGRDQIEAWIQQCYRSCQYGPSL